MAGYKLERINTKTSLKPAAHPKFSSVQAPDPGPANPTSTGQAGSGKGTRIESQVITDKDRAGSYLRIPARSKFALPAVDGYLDVSYERQRVDARWRVNGSRSGTIGFGRTIMSSIGTPNDSIWMRVDGITVVIED